MLLDVAYPVDGAQAELADRTGVGLCWGGDFLSKELFKLLKSTAVILAAPAPTSPSRRPWPVTP